MGRYPLSSSAEWVREFGENADVEVDHIEINPASFALHDYLFEGKAQVFVRHAAQQAAARAVNVTVFGRCDGRRAELDRFVFEHRT
ncbi:hypothetical protein A6302_04231 [Methylobrevis pamukkalensis]|uniref:Uncharacterized protein n=1 Tax=Methylobrevis pamukkalensis TaxID=1439726 RepID=A0A1E3GWZ7_9HYPH|nr:hypothetical protein A6302_04231 [Methylobrevis pamukkalensis]